MIPNLERTTIALSFYSTFTTDNAPAGRHAATYTHLRRKIGNAIVTRVWQPTRRWQLPSASRLQLARGSSTARRVAMRCCSSLLSFVLFVLKSEVSIQTSTSVLLIIFHQEFDSARGSCRQGCRGSAVRIQVNSILPWMRSPRSNMN